MTTSRPWLMALTALTLCACGGHGPDVAEQQGLALTFANGALGLKVGETVRLQAAPVDGTGKAFTGLLTVAWSSSAPTQASVGSDGVVTGVSVGTATITAQATRLDTGATASASVVVTVASATGDATAPSVPASVTATAVSSTQVNLTWAASTDNVGVAGYRIYRNGTLVGTSATTSFSDTGLSPATTSQYTVVAFDAAGNASAPSTAVSATTPAAPPPPAGLLAAYAFSQTTGTTLTDDSGNGHSGTFVGGPTWSTGKNGGGLQFNGTTASVTMGDVNALDGLTRFTVSAWVKTTATGEKHIVDKSACDGATNGGPFEFGTGFFTAGRATFIVYRTSGPSTFVYAESSASVTDGAWHFIAGVYDGTSLLVYVDGALAGTTAAAGLTMPATANALELGGHCNGNAYPWAGSVDDVRLYGRALSAAELASDMNTPVPPAAGGADAGTPPPPVDSGVKSDAGTPPADAGNGKPSYSLDFATATVEAELSAGGVWTNNSQGTGGNGPAGTQTSMAVGLASDGVTRIALTTNTGDGVYDDAFAFVPGFSGDQWAEAVIYKAPGYDTNVPNHEIELILGCSSAVGTRTWNEFLVNSGGGVDILYLDGDPGGFHNLTDVATFMSATPVDGDVIRATRVGNVLSLYLNGALWARSLGGNPAWVAKGSGIGLAGFIRPGSVPNKYGFRRVSMGSL